LEKMIFSMMQCKLRNITNIYTILLLNFSNDNLIEPSDKIYKYLDRINFGFSGSVFSN